jgi:hypothetical protein
VGSRLIKGVLKMKILVYVECGSLSDLDETLGLGVDQGIIEKYAALTIDGSPIVYEIGQDSNPEVLSGMAIRCAGITEE